MSLESALAAYLAVAKDVAAEPATVRRAASDVLSKSEQLTPEDAERALSALAEDIASRGASSTLSAMLAGALVEHGAPERFVRGALLSWLERCIDDCVPVLERVLGEGPPETSRSARPLPGSETEEDVDTGDDEQDVDDTSWVDERGTTEYAAWRLLHDVYLPCVAVLGASAEARFRSRPMLESLTKLEPYHPAAAWLRQIIAVLDAEPFVVIDVAARRGFSCTVSGVASNFELFVLLADALSGDPAEGWLDVEKPPAAVARCLRGEGPQECDASVKGAWNAYAYTALDADRHLPDASDYAGSEHWIWGEGEPWEIPSLEGTRVMLLGPPSYARFIPAQRTFSTLHARIDVERIAPDQVESWLARIALANAN